MLLGGVALTSADRLVPIPVPPHWTCVLVHPDAVLETRRAREMPCAATTNCASSWRRAPTWPWCWLAVSAATPRMVRAGLADVLVEPRPHR